MDCTIVNDNYYRSRKDFLQNEENCVLGSCSKTLSPTSSVCTLQTCSAPGFAASICYRMHRGIYNSNEDPDKEPDFSYLLNKCVNDITTMPSVYTKSFGECSKIKQ